MRAWSWAAGLLLALAGCGGGGGGGDADGGGGAAGLRLSISTTELTSRAAMGAGPPQAGFQLSVTEMPEGGLFADFRVSGRGVTRAFISRSSGVTADVAVVLEAPASLGPGTHEAEIQVSVCREDPCRTQIAGSPANVRVRYTVDSLSRVSAAPVTLEATAGPQEPAPQMPRPALRIDGPVAAMGLHYLTQLVGSTGAEGVRVMATADPAQMELAIDLRSPVLLAPMVHQGRIDVRVCYDAQCLYEVPGSPLQFPTSYTVTSGPAPPKDVAPLVVARRAALPHDVIDAEWSRALDAVVMVSSWPTNALIVHDPASGTSRSVALAKTPVAVSVSPDGRQAAVGHDALVTIVDLTTLGQTPAAAPVRLNLSSNVGDLVLDGTGHVHVFPATDQWVDVHTLKIADNTEVRTWAILYAGSQARLHPGGARIYTADRGLSPSDIAALEIQGDGVLRLGDSPYHGDYAMCGNLWFDELGGTIYTACGATFRASAVRSQDMLYSGTLPLATATQSGRIDWLSQYQAGKEIAVLETDTFGCSLGPSFGPCRSYLRLFESDFYGVRSTAWLGPVDVAGADYAQRGMFVFHAANGQRVLISRLLAMPNRAAEFHLSVLP